MTVLSLHTFPACHRSKYAWGFKGEGLRLETEGWNRVPAVLRIRIPDLRLQKEKGPERWARIGKLC
jgi:hypothetical protein